MKERYSYVSKDLAIIMSQFGCNMSYYRFFYCDVLCDILCDVLWDI